MKDYSIFDHAQLGHLPETEQKHSAEEQADELKQTTEAAGQRRVRAPRGWAVEAGLGLGPAFK